MMTMNVPTSRRSLEYVDASELWNSRVVVEMDTQRKRSRSIDLKDKSMSDEFKAKMVESLRQRFDGQEKLASAFEKVLFRHTPVDALQSQHASPDKALNEALQQVLLAVLERRVRKHAAENDRSAALRAALGPQHEVVMELVHEINVMRLSRASVGCSSASCLAGLCEHPAARRDLPREIPKPVRKLFFQNALARAIESTPTARLPMVDWTKLMEEAREDLLQYREWANHGDSSEPHAKRTRVDYNDDQF